MLHIENRIAENEKLVDSEKKRQDNEKEFERSIEIQDKGNKNFLTMESLILAQDERWRRASYMQVEREIHFGEWKVADG